MPRKRLLVLVLFLATALAFVVCFLIARPFLPALAWALAQALIAHPLHDGLARRTGRPNLAAALAGAVVTVALVEVWRRRTAVVAAAQAIRSSG